MKSLLLVSVLFLFNNAFAGPCVDAAGKEIGAEPVLFQAEIAKQEFCYQAVELASSCAWGSSLDVGTASLAGDICSAELANNNPQQSDLDLLKTMTDRCSAKYANMDGTLYMSMNAYCQLDALKWIVDLSYEE